MSVQPKLMSNVDSISLLNAIDFAAEKHKNQRRKGAEKLPYINHPVGVAKLISSIGGITDVNVLIGAVLHE
jgi:(p)ppGpp synthase/HD superfamily hydrolase